MNLERAIQIAVEAHAGAKDGVAKWDGEDLNLILDVYKETFLVG